ncbi:MAG TPA: hypothetical protein VFU31_02255 [Candidatus Binatia bacterium]|nr:hypothetical protein [Candidatus Binatia bacterium]
MSKPAARTLVSVFVVAVLLNYLWELAQAPLYLGLEDYTATVFWHCFVASLGDGLMVLLIFVAGWITLNRWDWFKQPGVAGYLAILSAGFVLAILVESVAVHIMERWAYTETMPTLPGARIGLVPIAQMLVLPPLIFRIVALLDPKKCENCGSDG